MKTISELDKTLCYGCRACEQACPKHCISIIPDAYGFNIPQINSKDCIECSICVKSCPRIQYKEPTNIPTVYAIKHKNNKVRYYSSSGAAFTALSDAIIDLGGYIAGCFFNSNSQRLAFKLTNTNAERALMRGSKYVQADTANIYNKIKEKLISNNYVLFVGTPCQCEGLKTFLKKAYERLLIVDILCHSAPSPLILSETLKQFTHVDQIVMRDKENGWRGSSGMKIWHNGIQSLDYKYMTLFYKGLINRDSCATCQFTKTNRCSDITIGDYWKINQIKPEFEDDLGVSLLITNTEKGRKLFQSIMPNIFYVETEMNACKQFCMQRPTRPSSKKSKFWKDFHSKGYDYVAKKYGYKTWKDTFISDILAPIIRKIGISNIIRKFYSLK